MERKIIKDLIKWKESKNRKPLIIHGARQVGKTYIIKKLNGKVCISDDSGIEIEYLNGFPGVFTKRWHCGTDRDRNLEIIKKLDGVKKENRKVKFITAIAVAKGDEVVTSVEELNGYIAKEVRGKNGFGFDEIFELENGKTLAELSQEEKNQISARKIALEKLKQKLFLYK